MRLFQLLSSIGLATLVILNPRPAFAFDEAILAVVNDDIITVNDLQEYLKSIFAQLKIEGNSPEQIEDVMAQYRAKGIEQLIDDRLILGAADKLGVQIKPKAIDERLDEIKGKYKTYQDFLNAVVKEGMTVSEVRKKIENQFKGQIMVEREVRSKIQINPQEVTDYYNKNRPSYTRKPRIYVESIFVRKGNDADEARDKINKALNEIEGGVEFKSVSAKYSELPSVGAINEEDLRPDLRDRILSLPLGGTSNIIEVDDGFYLFKLEGKTEGSQATLKEVKDRIYQELFEKKFRERFKSWLEDLRKKAYVELKK